MERFPRAKYLDYLIRHGKRLTRERGVVFDEVLFSATPVVLEQLVALLAHGLEGAA